MTGNTRVAAATERAISAQFGSRPTFKDVVWQQLSEAILQRYPTIPIDPSLTRVGIPNGNGQLELTSLLTLALDFLGGGDPPDFQARNGHAVRLVDETLIIKLSAPGEPSTFPDMPLIQQMIIELPWTLVAALQNSVAAYWSDNADTGASRWQWLSDRLMDTLRISGLEQAGLNDLERETLDQLVRYPNREQRLRLFGDSVVHAYCPEWVFTHGTQVSRQLSPALLLVRAVDQHTCVLLCSPSGVCERFASVDGFTQTWGQRMAADYEVAQVTVNRYEPEGNTFDSYAATLLNQQLENLQAVPIPASEGIEQLEALHWSITEPGHYFPNPERMTHPVLTPLQGQLPAWLAQASAADRIAYRHYSLVLASAKKRSKGLTFLSGIVDIRTFTHAALLSQLKLDYARFGEATDALLHPDDLQLTFSQSAGLPGAVGITHHTSMSLTDLAISNLLGKPGSLTAINSRDGRRLPAWLTPDYITRSGGLIEQVDIGKTYPRMLTLQLLGDGPRITERETSFAEQTAAQLPLQALELKLKRQNGLTARGVQSVCALLREDPQERSVNGQAIVIRQLAWVRKPGATADAVANMFIIEAQRIETGPHLLYRPLYAEPLQEFATRALLLQALVQPGELQTSVLTWLPDVARPIYENGGFDEPHYVRFGMGSDFAVIETPRPATLATEDVNNELQSLFTHGKLMQYLYGSNARALIDQADRESVSNSESRWAVLMEGAGLLFNTLLLPFLRGPAMLTGWLISLISSASRDIPALESPDPVTRELALVDLLLNVGMLLLQLPAAVTRAPVFLGHAIRPKALSTAAPRRVAGQWPQPQPPHVHAGTVALDSNALHTQSSVFDFSFASPRAQLTPSQQARLVEFRVPKPQVLPPPGSSGPNKGLYTVKGNTYAEVEEHWYRVETRTDGTVVVVLASDANVPGPQLTSDGDGHWSLDLKLRLRGGMPVSRIEAARQLKAARKAQLTQAYDQLLEDQAALQNAANAAQTAMERDDNSSTRRTFEAAIHAQTQRYVQLLDSLKERCELQIPVPPTHVKTFLSNTIKNARKASHIAAADRLALCAVNQEFFDHPRTAAQQMLTQKERYSQFVRQLVEINERQIQALERQDRYLRELSELGSQGAQEYESLTRDREGEITALGVKYLQLQSLKFSIYKNLADFPSELSDVLDPLGAQVRTHAELNQFELTPDERLEVLTSLSEHYGRAVDALQGQALVHADALDMNYFSRVQKLLGELYQEATRQLAGVLKPDAQRQVARPKRPLVIRETLRKKVFKTRRHGTLIGDLQPAGNVVPIDVIEVRSEQDKKLLGTYSLKGEVWDEVEGLPPEPPSTLATRALTTVKRNARALLGSLNQTLAREEGYAKMTRYPVEIQGSLNREAARYTEMAAELERALKADPKRVTQPAEQSLLNQLNDAATALTQKGLELRIQTSLALPPTHANLAYLFEQKKVQVARLGNRIRMNGPRQDYVQEYAINDRNGAPLWYAHFHYLNANTPKESYFPAHMKIIEQRTESYYSLLAKSSGDQSTVDVHRGLIGKSLAQRYFLPLAP